MRLIVGLGNPGLQYRSTRHNVGFQCVDLMTRRWGIPTRERRAKAVLGRGNYAGHEVVLAKPRNFMNNSGEGVSYLLTRFAAKVEDLVVIYDDMELPLGSLRIRTSGSDGGHKGVRSIIAELDTEDFPRIRLGIGPAPPEQDPVEFLLSAFSNEEAAAVDRAVETVVSAAECLLEEGINIAMNRFN